MKAKITLIIIFISGILIGGGIVYISVLGGVKSQNYLVQTAIAKNSSSVTNSVTNIFEKIRAKKNPGPVEINITPKSKFQVKDTSGFFQKFFKKN